MSKETPEVGDIWENRDGEHSYIAKVYKNASVLSQSIRTTYRIIEYTGGEGVNVMECDRDDLIEYLGKSQATIQQLFEVNDD